MRGFKRFLSFCIVGGIGSLVELGAFNVFYLFLNFPLSKLLALSMALIINFTVNRNITFSASSGSKRKQALRYLILYSFAIVINYSSSLVANFWLGNELIYANISTVIGIVVAIPITFFGSLLWVFREHQKTVLQ